MASREVTTSYTPDSLDPSMALGLVSLVTWFHSSARLPHTLWALLSSSQSHP